MRSWQTQNRLFITLLIGIFILVGLLAVRYDRAWDLTFNQRNQLSQTSIDIVKKLDEPLHIAAFTRGNPKVKSLINRLLSRYKAHGDVNWTFKNPDSEIDVVRQYGISRDGEMLLTYKGKTLLVDTLNETAITRGIYLSLAGRVRKAVFTAGQGEIGFSEGVDNFAQLKKRLQDEEITVSQVDLSLIKQVPEDTDVLVIGAPNFAFDEVEVMAINDYVIKGGRVLWLASQTKGGEQPALSRLMGARFAGGALMGQGGKHYGFKNSSYVPIVPDQKQPTQALLGIDTMLVFPGASPIVILPTEQAKRWEANPLLKPNGDWFMRDGNQVSKAPTPLWIGLSLTSLSPDVRGQWWLIGDADFATDRFIGQGQNSDFVINTIRYLTSPDVGHINIENAMPKPVVLSEKALAHLSLLVVLGVPIVVLLIGFVVRRRLYQ